MKSEARVRLDRLRLGEWIMLAASIALIVDLVAFPWYSLREVYAAGLSSLSHTSAGISSGSAFHILTPLAIICVMLAWAACIVQVVQRGPAVPLALTAITTILTAILSIALFIRVVFDQPTEYSGGTGTTNLIKPDAASVAGLFFAIILLFGCWRALRTDGLVPADNPRRIETLRLAPRPR